MAGEMRGVRPAPTGANIVSSDHQRDHQNRPPIYGKAPRARMEEGMAVLMIERSVPLVTVGPSLYGD